MNTDHDHARHEDDGLIDALHDMWERHDPMPDGLPERIIVEIALRDLELDAEVLSLVAHRDELLGVRASARGRSVFEFSSEDRSLVLRVAASGGGHFRVDGWVSPAGYTKATLRSRRRDVTSAIDAGGRFDFTGVHAGDYTLTLDGHAEYRPLTTHLFTIEEPR